MAAERRKEVSGDPHSNGGGVQHNIAIVPTLRTSASKWMELPVGERAERGA
jgi:hypothetical protein